MNKKHIMFNKNTWQNWYINFKEHRSSRLPLSPSHSPHFNFITPKIITLVPSPIRYTQPPHGSLYSTDNRESISPISSLQLALSRHEAPPPPKDRWINDIDRRRKLSRKLPPKLSIRVVPLVLLDKY